MASLRSFLEVLTPKLALESGFSVVLISDPAMARYNARYRGKQGPTDVLSFPDAKVPWEEQDGYLGDILISVETADRRKPAGLRQEIESLCLHGLLHLLGYDHEKDDGQMEALEGRIRKELGLV
ncbi:MAG: rRNA maturation RNase YbeY [Acidobacteriota bacterium]